MRHANYAHTVASNIRAMRTAAGLSCSAAAKRIGTHYQTWHSWECGRRIPSLVMAHRIATLLNVSLDKLVEGANE